MKHRFAISLLLLLGVALCCACRRDEPEAFEKEQVAPPETVGQVVGFYLLNQGNMGSNKATLDYFDYTTGIYSRNIFANRNPEVTKELGDVGNDLKAYGEKLYAVINCSNLIEVMDLRTARHIKAIEVPNCRYLAFANGKAYVSSYAGPVQLGNKILGRVVEIDTTTLQITRSCTVGYNPEEMAVIGQKLYVVNSGGYLIDEGYDNRLSVIDLESFTELKKIELTPNMQCIRVTGQNQLLISSRGNYGDQPSNLLLFDPESETVAYNFGRAASNMSIWGDQCLLYAWQYDQTTGTEHCSYYRIDTRHPEAAPAALVTDGTDGRIAVPFCIGVHPETGDFLLGDAADYVSPGTLYCFSASGRLKWKTTTGDIPAAVAFVHQKP
ncbi:MAG: YncE family protein [Paludibacteraceae bacterium]|nr:YncE family protein [Paludibacteraceae bacterium]